MAAETSTKTKWIVDPVHTLIQFKVKHMMITNVTGTFEKYEIEAETEGDDFLKSKILFRVETASVSTNDTSRDNHLRSSEFFDSEKYPNLTFVPTKFEIVDNDGSYEMYGNLTIRDITKEIKLDVEYGGVIKDPWGGERAGFTINGKINRKDWNLNWNVALEAGGILVSDDVRINCEVQLVKQQVLSLI